MPSKQGDESGPCTESRADRPKRAGSRGPIRMSTRGLEADKRVRMQTTIERVFIGWFGQETAWFSWREGHAGAGLLAVN